ncbi:DUF4362 domain-containing protein [Niallia nealsonii]|uniref:Uncharacterized protein n=1 Tax=Niallia nealsonii TaxID=115979 RepID=A0A2N0Z0C5_9BACI|nr:DUF4362 domain-containing protein [Niallia nealsonii]PKG22967.1 hypothetical protein CWS01_14945 [Niallia nealsonii]
MERYVAIIIAILCINSLAACSKSESIAPHHFYSSEEAIKNGDIVIHGEINNNNNIERWDQFLKKVAEKQTDTIRITSYTNEGD